MWKNFLSYLFELLIQRMLNKKKKKWKKKILSKWRANIYYTFLFAFFYFIILIEHWVANGLSVEKI